MTWQDIKTSASVGITYACLILVPWQNIIAKALDVANSTGHKYIGICK